MLTKNQVVTVVDYGMGNLRSVSQAVMHVAQGSEFQVVVTQRPEEVMQESLKVLNEVRARRAGSRRGAYR